MPELPEVETTCRAIRPWLEGRRLRAIEVRDRRLRWPVPTDLETTFCGVRVERVERRAKYLLLRTARGTALLHLGMSGSLRLVPDREAPSVHDHFDLCLDRGRRLRYRDPRRFGSLLFTRDDPTLHPLLRALGPEPLGPQFHAAHLQSMAKGRKVAVKPFLMDGKVVVGVGNIYANEALHRARIHPARAAGRISLERLERLCDEVRAVLRESIEAGGTTLRDFQHGAGETGCYAVELAVYGRTGEPCTSCGTKVRETRLGQRSTFFCPRCQV